MKNVTEGAAFPEFCNECLLTAPPSWQWGCR